MKEQEQNKVASFEKLTGDAAARIIASSSHEDESIVGFEEAEAKRLGFKFGDVVSIMPTDNGKGTIVSRELKSLTYHYKPKYQHQDA